MKNYQLHFQMISQDTTQEFKTTAKSINGTLHFQEPNGDTHIITQKSDTLLYEKQGSRSMSYQFHEEKTTKGYYDIEDISFAFDIVTTSLNITPNTMTILFQLYQNKSQVNSMELHIRYDALKEEYNAKK